MKPLNGAAKERVADFVHGSDGFGNTDQPEPKVSSVLYNSFLLQLNPPTTPVPNLSSLVVS